MENGADIPRQTAKELEEGDTAASEGIGPQLDEVGYE
jgi:hypothetical protein